MDVVAAYRATRERVTALVTEAGPEVAELPVPACPDWTVRQVVAHLAGVCDDIVNNRLEGVGTDPWTAVQVTNRSDRSLTDLLAEWTEAGAKVEDLLATGMPEQLVFDEVTHEHDLRGALRQPGAHECDAVEMGLNFAVAGMDFSVTAAELPAVLVRSDGGQERTIGQGDTVATLTASSFDLMRSFTGRRTVAQVAALDWGGADPTPWLGALAYGPFTLPSAQWRWAGEWQPLTLYYTLDLVAQGGSVYLVQHNHTSDAAFTADAEDTAGFLYARLIAPPDQPYDVGMFHAGAIPGDESVLLQHVATRSFVLPIGFADSTAFLLNPVSTDNISLTIYKNAELIGHLEFNIDENVLGDGGQLGSFVGSTPAAEVQFSRTDRLSIFAPDIVDATASGLSITFAARAGTI